jgi:hypothetical protein
MASPTVRSTAVTNGTTASATPTINLPATVVAGDIIVVAIRQDNEESYTWPSADWLTLPPLPDTSDGADDQTSCRYKIADGSEGGTTIQLTRTQSNKFAAISYAIAGATNIEAGGLATGASTTPDPLNFAPSGGSQDYLWLSIGAWEGEQTSPPSATPTNYTNKIGANSGTAGATATNCRIAGVNRATTASAENPGSWTISVSDDWTAFVVALWTPPAVPGRGGRNVRSGPGQAAQRAVR